MRTEAGRIDAGILNQLYGSYQYHAENWYDWNDIHPTTLVFAPSPPLLPTTAKLCRNFTGGGGGQGAPP